MKPGGEDNKAASPAKRKWGELLTASREITSFIFLAACALISNLQIKIDSKQWNTCWSPALPHLNLTSAVHSWKRCEALLKMRR